MARRAILFALLIGGVSFGVVWDRANLRAPHGRSAEDHSLTTSGLPDPTQHPDDLVLLVGGIHLVAPPRKTPRSTTPAPKALSPATRPAARSRLDPPASPTSRERKHQVQSGETLRGIASREMGTPNAWSLIASRNGIADPRQLRVGQELVIPEAVVGEAR